MVTAVMIDSRPEAVEPGIMGYISTGPESGERVTAGNIPARRAVDIFQVQTKPYTHIRSTISTSAGVFKVPGLDPAVELDVIVREDRANRVYRDVIIPSVFPVTDD